jgi:hypothetical protein
MEIGVPNSFIPHDATTPNNEPRRYDSGGGLSDLIALVALVLFFASGALAAGTFLYQQYLNGESASKQAQIQQAQAAFNPALIQQLTRLDERMNSASTILGAHIAPSAFFGALNATTLTTVSFQNLQFDGTDPHSMTLKMNGVARDVNSIALQADLFSKGGVITDPIFSGIDQQADGVHFNVTATVNPAALDYVTLVTGGTAAGVNQLPASSSTSPAAGAPAASPFTGAPATTTK